MRTVSSHVLVLGVIVKKKKRHYFIEFASTQFLREWIVKRGQKDGINKNSEPFSDSLLAVLNV